MIEILYGQGYIKLLIATETFAVGINMGIKSVVFTSLSKYDGKGFRYLMSHEYGQKDSLILGACPGNVLFTLNYYTKLKACAVRAEREKS